MTKNFNIENVDDAISVSIETTQGRLKSTVKTNGTRIFLLLWNPKDQKTSGSSCQSWAQNDWASHISWWNGNFSDAHLIPNDLWDLENESISNRQDMLDDLKWIKTDGRSYGSKYIEAMKTLLYLEESAKQE